MTSCCIDDRGTVTTESAFVLLVLLGFLLLSPAIWRIWIAENAARADAHRSAYYKSVLPVVLPNFLASNPRHWPHAFAS